MTKKTDPKPPTSTTKSARRSRRKRKLPEKLLRVDDLSRHPALLAHVAGVPAGLRWGERVGLEDIQP